MQSPGKSIYLIYHGEKNSNKENVKNKIAKNKSLKHFSSTYLIPK